MGRDVSFNTQALLQPLTAGSTRVAVAGMTCGNCARHVREAIQSVSSVASAEVELERGEATIRWRAKTLRDEGAVFQAIRKAGFEPSDVMPRRTELAVDGMTCSGCARKVSEALKAAEGVASAEVELDNGRAAVLWKPGVQPDAQGLIDALKRVGFSAQAREKSTEPSVQNAWSPFSGWQFNVVAGSILTVPLFIMEWVFGAGAERWYHWVAFALVLPVQTLCGARFYRGAWNQLRVGSSNMDTLVVLGSTTAFVYSAWGLFSGWAGHLFFMESASIITLISVGHWVEAKISARAAKSLRALLNLTPPVARRLNPDGVEVQVPVGSLRVGDRVVTKPGDRVPIDCEVVDGASVVDESMLTGEATPVNKKKGAVIYGGTTNLQGWLLGRVSATGEATALAQIVAVVQRAQSSRANIQRLGDRISSVFVPIVVLVALATGLWWGLAPESARAVSGWFEPWLWHPHHPEGALAAAIYHAASVLIIACPCAMGLATPIAIMAGTNVAAERGILIRDGLALEKTGLITSVLFDKTGTLTTGRMELAEAKDFLGSAEQEIGLTRIAASLAKPSAHPLSHALAGLSKTTLPVRDWQEVSGAGVQGRLETGSVAVGLGVVRLGSLAWLRENGVDAGPASEFINSWSAQGATMVGLAADQRLLGVLALRDSLKDHAREVITGLARQRIKSYLVTGDNERTAAAIADQAGIPRENVFAQVRPEEKAALVKRLQDQNERVAFVGDGINDAPALEQADLGIAVAKASDVAREAADLILLNSELTAVPESLALAQATLRTIKQNLFWAFFYNAAAIPLAALGFFSPILSAFAMGVSDLILIGNTLRLRRWRMRSPQAR